MKQQFMNWSRGISRTRGTVLPEGPAEPGLRNQLCFFVIVSAPQEKGLGHMVLCGPITPLADMVMAYYF